MWKKGVEVSKEVTVAKKRDQRRCAVGNEVMFEYLPMRYSAGRKHQHPTFNGQWYGGRVDGGRFRGSTNGCTARFGRGRLIVRISLQIASAPYCLICCRHSERCVLSSDRLGNLKIVSLHKGMVCCVFVTHFCAGTFWSLGLAEQEFTKRQ